ncbi:hypothetical protein Tco_0806588 [Tanacetum coccineum]
MKKLRIRKRKTRRASKFAICKMFDEVHAWKMLIMKWLHRLTQMNKRSIHDERAGTWVVKTSRLMEILYEISRGGMKDCKRYGFKILHTWIQRKKLLKHVAAKYEMENKVALADGSSSYHGDTQAFLRRLDRQDLNDLYSYGVHTLFMDGKPMEINMLVEKKYPLVKELLEKMLNLQLEAEEESTMAFKLIKFINSMLKVVKCLGTSSWCAGNHSKSKYVPISKSIGVKLFLGLDSVLKHMTGDRSQLTNFVNKFLSTVKFGNDHMAKIMGYGDYQIGNVMISRVYYVEGLGHNLFSVGQFCDSNLEAAFHQHTCFIRNLEGVDLLTGSQDNNLYTLSLGDMMASSPICLLSKASKTKSWLWH